ncbi:MULTISPECIES: hypothetical protein [unclassified Mesorhizobium]|uniref:hypothetical protein n=1 Tax=unclassified Mesorhizobium TaxID=325217 RepID=UPI00112D16E5|nr:MULTISPECIES: hypothetical protein [unclassified Mesorhizobium]TPJ86976.1 hypothetical protein FJ489_30990 [Mesorhizobium sp. B2-5-12]TPK19199.1 hypothetical protein FJ562_31395 [Mesorhizobium sp. B2-5-6]
MSRPSHASHVWLFAFVDVLLVLTFVLASFVFLALPQINPPARDNPDALPPPGSLAVVAAWPEGSVDVDLWLKSPDDDKPVGYSRKDGTVCALLRDDLGTTNDGSPFNAENAFCRALPAGEYVVNTHAYSVPAEGVKVHVEIALNGRLLVSRDMDLRPKQERTVARFTLDGGGQVVSSNEVYLPLRSANK